ncbi:MAG: helix-turn-helix transcriptional regulator [Lentisphaerae bacterium]|nr:helix-turn-helix transcriptional regulator [Lentisphaerota bacterium]
MSLPGKERFPPSRLGMLYRYDLDGVPLLARCMEYSHPVTGMRDVHYHLEFGVVLQGRVRRYAREHEEILELGGVWYSGIWEPHGIELLDYPNRHLVITVEPRMLAEARFGSFADVNWLAPFSMPPHRRPQLPADRRDEGIAIAERIATLSASDSRQALLHVQLLFLELLLILQREEAVARTQAAPADAFETVGKAVHMVFSATKPLSVTDAARALGTSRQTLGRHFKHLMNMSFSEFVLNHRLGMAAARLAATADPVKAVALAWGFKQTSHLDRCFRRRFGCSPGEYRQRTRS